MGELSAPIVVLRVTVRAPDLDAFITRYSRHIAGDRIFIFSKAPQPVGTQVRFNLQLSGGEVLIQGRGTVKRVQADLGDPRHPPGMEVQFTPLDDRSATLVDFMMATRAGLTESVASAGAPIVRAVLRPKPPALPRASRPTPLSPLSPLPPLPPSSSPSLPPWTLPAPALPPPPAAKPTPVARPPSLSLESIWKDEAGEATAVEGPTSVVEPDAVPPSPAEPPEPPAPPAPPAPNLPTIIPALVDPSTSSPPVFAESWAGDAPANPFSDVSDGAIEYFVEWSLEQSIGPRALPQARFSDVAMALPERIDPHAAVRSRRRRRIEAAATFAAGAFAGAAALALLGHSAPAPRPRSAAVSQLAGAPAAEAPVAGAPLVAVAQHPSASPPVAAADAELIVTTRPPGATVTIDGQAAGATPLVTHVRPGPHEVAVAKERYAAATAPAAAPGRLALDLRRPSATLHVTSTPPAADVLIAGEHRGKTPVDVRLPGFERYDVRVALGGARPWHKSVYLGHASNRIDVALAVAKAPAGGGRSGRR